MRCGRVCLGVKGVVPPGGGSGCMGVVCNGVQGGRCRGGVCKCVGGCVGGVCFVVVVIKVFITLIGG